MKTLRSILIINLLILCSCTVNNDDSNSKVDIKQKRDVSDSIIETHDKLDHEKKATDSIIEKDIKNLPNDDLKVIIDNKVYYKKKLSDFKVRDKYVYRNDNKYDYDIRTGEFIPRRDYGGKVVTKDKKKDL